MKGLSFLPWSFLVYPQYPWYHFRGIAIYHQNLPSFPPLPGEVLIIPAGLILQFAWFQYLQPLYLRFLCEESKILAFLLTFINFISTNKSNTINLLSIQHKFSTIKKYISNREKSWNFFYSPYSVQFFEIRLTLIVPIIHFLDESLALATIGLSLALFLKAIVWKSHFHSYFLTNLFISVI